MKKLCSILVCIAALTAALFAGGAIRPLGLTSTLSGMRAAVNGQPGTFLMSDGNMIMLAWEQGSGYAFAVVQQEGKPIADFIQRACGQANKVCWQTMSEFVRWMESTGWKCIGPASLPPALVTSLNSAVSWLGLASRSWPTILVMPVIAATPPATLNFGSVEQ